MDGSLSFRVKGAKPPRKDYAKTLPVFSVDSVFEAQALIQKVGWLRWIGGGPAYVVPHFEQDIAAFPRVVALFEKAQAGE